MHIHAALSVWYLFLAAGLGSVTLDVLNQERFGERRRELFYHLLDQQYYSIPETVEMPAGESEALLPIDFTLGGQNNAKPLDMSDKYILPLTIQDDPSYNYQATEATDREGKAANYAVVQELAAEFKKRNGSLICGELLGLKKKDPVSTIPEERTAQYYSKRPCAKMVEEAARIWSEYLEKHPK